MRILSSITQFKNAYAPIFSISSGKETLSRAEQPEKADDETDFTDEGIVTDLIVLLFSKADIPTAVTFLPSIISGTVTLSSAPRYLSTETPPSAGLISKSGLCCANAGSVPENMSRTVIISETHFNKVFLFISSITFYQLSTEPLCMAPIIFSLNLGYPRFNSVISSRICFRSPTPSAGHLLLTTGSPLFLTSPVIRL